MRFWYCRSAQQSSRQRFIDAEAQKPTFEQIVAAKYILAILSVVFLLAAGLRLLRDGGRIASASRTWLLVALIFAAVSLWLWVGQG